jgi:uncharacterized SAM-binding protein YcdF (DUF218 family)
MFWLSKILWTILVPGNALLLLLVAGVALGWWPGRRAQRLGRRVVVLVTALLVAIAVLPVRDWVVGPLEDRFPRQAALPADVVGLITVGGALDQITTKSRDQVALTGGAERLTEFVALARTHPGLRLVYTGGSGSPFHQDIKETTAAKRFFAEIGLDPARVLFEGESRDTYENAIRTAALVRPVPGQRWVVITSAMHLPRTVGVFRKAGFTVLPYPVDYQTREDDGGGLRLGLTDGLTALDNGAHEWVGLIAYWLAGRTDSLFPAP